jgi:LuxR family transcriptional regulator, maltose regulon positive regulatory protein
MPSLLVTKLYIPRLRSAHVQRAHLLAALDAGLERKLILIAAAAGFGKTTVVAEWASQRAESVCWLSLDKGDNDPLRFLSYVIAAIQTRRPNVGQELLAALQSPQTPPADTTLVMLLINQLAAIPERIVLVLDDYHVINNGTVHAALAFLLDHLPPNMTLVLLTRTDPPLPLATLRAKRDLLELRAADLRFSDEDAARFLNETMGVGLSAEAVRALDTRTEGWIAGLQLAAIAMQALPGDREAFVRSFTGSHRFVLDYLIEEVLARQPEDVRRFLLRTSILRRLNGSLANAVTGETDGQAMIEALERNNLFLIALDQQRYWYRYHHLFADLLQARLQAENPGILGDVRRRAALWHEQNGLPEEAIVYALAAGDYEYAARLIVGPAANVMRRSEVTTLLDWYAAFPPGFVGTHPRLALYFGLAFALNGRWDEAESLLDGIERGSHADVPPEELLLLSYLIGSARSDAARLEAVAAEAAANTQRDRVTRLVLALLTSLTGDLREACVLMTDAQEASEREGDYGLAMTALFHRCRLNVYAGDFQQANALCREALRRIEQIGSAALPMATFAHSALGRILIEWNELDEAERHLREAIRLAELSGFVTGTVSSGTVMLAEVMQARGDADGAARIADEALALAHRYDPPPEVLWLMTYRARLWLNQGNVAAAGDWMREMQTQALPASLFYPHRIRRVTQARVLLAQRKLEEAVSHFTALAAEPPDLLSVEALAGLALVRQAHGDSVHAGLTLEQALALGEPQNRVRVFLDYGAPMAKLLARFCEIHPDSEFARRLLALFDREPDSTQVEALGERELEVLRLIVAGKSNDEIAAALFLTVSTVKWYINVLYSKLRVKSRSQAIARAHELRLFDH